MHSQTVLNSFLSMEIHKQQKFVPLFGWKILENIFYSEIVRDGYREI